MRRALVVLFLLLNTYSLTAFTVGKVFGEHEHEVAVSVHGAATAVCWVH